MKNVIAREHQHSYSYIHTHRLLTASPSNAFCVPFDYSPICWKLNSDKGICLVHRLSCSVPSGGQLSQCKYTDPLCLRSNLLPLLTGQPSGSCSTCGHDSWQELWTEAPLLVPSASAGPAAHSLVRGKQPWTRWGLAPCGGCEAAAGESGL